MWSVIIPAAVAVVLFICVAFIARIIKSYRQKAVRAGYPSLHAYLVAVPRSEEEKRDAVDMALKGMILCIIGLLLPPLMLLGIFPLFYGARKITYTLMGFGLFEDLPKQ